MGGGGGIDSLAKKGYEKCYIAIRFEGTLNLLRCLKHKASIYKTIFAEH